MNRVTTKVTDLESLKKAKLELEEHIHLKQVNIQLEVNNFKEGLLKTNESNKESVRDLFEGTPINKTLSKLIVSKFIKPKSKLVSKVSNFLRVFLIDKYGGTLQHSIAKWLGAKEQTKLDGKP